MIPSIEEVRHREAIRDVIARYALGLDTRDLELIRTCFAPDAEADYSGVVITGGADALIEWLAKSSPESSMHVMANTHVGIDGDTARSVTYALVYMMVKDAAGERRLRSRGLEYTDELVLLETGWAIRYRTHRAKWEFQVTPVHPPLAPGMGAAA